MKKVITALVCFSIILTISQCSTERTFSDDPYIIQAHGALIGKEGIFEPNSEYILKVQNSFISKYADSLTSKSFEEYKKVKRLISTKVPENILSNALLLDWIAEELNLNNTSSLVMANKALRWYHIEHTLGHTMTSDSKGRWTKGLKIELAKDLAAEGLKVFDESISGTPTYISNCIGAGVPIPGQMFDDSWESLGILSDQMVFGDADSELRIHLSKDPPGFCLALIRLDAGDLGNHFDLICFGTESNNACFFESTETGITLGEETKITDLLSGENTFGNVCIGCHLGENPYIVHPTDPAFEKAAERKGTFFNTPFNLNGTDMFTAINVPTWPDNPPPFDDLDAYQTNDLKCTTCHTSSNAGRFPDLNQVTNNSSFSAYCSTIIPGTLGELGGFNATMPFGDIDNIDAYSFQIDQLKYMCGDNPDNGKVIDNPIDKDTEVISPPQVVDPLIQCAKIIYVIGYKQEAEVVLFINDIEVDKINNVSGIDPLEFKLLDDLKINDKVQVLQRKDGFTSPLSTAISVIDYKTIFPNGLPQPVIQPNTVYECSSVLSVLYDIPGLELEVKVNGEDPVIRHTFKGYKVLKPGKTPFIIGDNFSAQVLGCSESSPISSTVSAAEAPSNIESATIDPESIFPGQSVININNLTYGSESTVIDANGNVLSSFSTSLSWKKLHLSEPIQSGDQIFIGQKICDISSDGKRSPIVRPCSDIPFPSLKDPEPGENFIFVLESVSGADVHIFDSNGNELGDSNLPFIYLTRELVAGETITAYIQIGNCISPLAIQYFV